MVYKLGKNSCPNRKCGSSDAFHWYGDEKGGHCFVCGWTIKSKDESEEEIEWDIMNFTEAEKNKLKAACSFNPKGFRGLREDTCKHFGVMHEYNERGQLAAQYYMMTTEGKFTGFKKRAIPKTFSALNLEGTAGVGQENDMFGQYRFEKSQSKTCVIVGGELDQLSAYQMLRDYQLTRNADYAPYAIVSPTVGETGCLKQIQKHYDFFNRFEKIIVCFDNDAQGAKGTEKIVKALPKGKIFLMDMELKDANEYLTQKRERDFIRAFFDAKPYTPSGVVGSTEILAQVQEAALMPRLSLPAYMATANKILGNGIRVKSIVNIVAGTSIGKTTLVNGMVKHWIFNSPYKVGVVTLEEDVPGYGELLLSEHVGRKLALIDDPIEKEAYLRRDDIVEKANDLFIAPDGTPRFYLVDDRGDFDSLPKKIEEMIISCGVQVVVIDPLSDALAGKSSEDQELFMAWQKQMKKSHDIIFVNIVHIRKAQNGQKDAGRGADIDESAMFGSSSISKSADINMMLSRDKYADDELERNTTRVVIPKNRGVGITGGAGEIYYDNKTHRLFAKEEWLKDHPVDF